MCTFDFSTTRRGLTKAHKHKHNITKAMYDWLLVMFFGFCHCSSGGKQIIRLQNWRNWRWSVFNCFYPWKDRYCVSSILNLVWLSVTSFLVLSYAHQHAVLFNIHTTGTTRHHTTYIQQVFVISSSTRSEFNCVFEFAALSPPPEIFLSRWPTFYSLY